MPVFFENSCYMIFKGKFRLLQLLTILCSIDVLSSIFISKFSVVTSRKKHSNEIDQQFAYWLLSLGNTLLPVNTEIGEDAHLLITRWMCYYQLMWSLVKHFLQVITQTMLAEPYFAHKMNVLINNSVLDPFPGDNTEYHSVGSVPCDDPDKAKNYPIEFLNNLNNNNNNTWTIY